ncbi:MULTISPECIES: DUF6685 family protein [Brucella]|jgi:hypothetical protein|uniref:DUF6685 family protein n=1 Tax=Brucella TaxID=234 RepID=UPI0002894D3C|nr:MULTISPECIES: DUF6685 family protein [Brucella]KAB2786775.1 hypothetical protein F9K96_21220 [Brucella anthropi]QOD66422.1 hypothetical protein HGK82_15990 [Ochrobactrum sp. MT180101]UZD71764.1 hypothetical protein LJ361_10580 [Brucella sp. JSBI001]
METNSNAPETLLQFDWQPERLYLMNSGGSHHFTAGQYIAARLQMRVPLTGKLERHGIRLEALDEIDRGYSVFAMRKPESDAWWKFVRAMEALRTEFHWFDSPYRHSGHATRTLNDRTIAYKPVIYQYHQCAKNFRPIAVW